MQVTFQQAKKIITNCFKTKNVPMLRGSPACGKSALYRELAEEFNLLLIDKRLSQCDPTDLSGFPYIDDGKADYVPFRELPVEGDVVPEGYDGYLLLLDEFNSAVSPTIQA